MGREYGWVVKEGGLNLPLRISLIKNYLQIYFNHAVRNKNISVSAKKIKLAVTKKKTRKRD